MSAVIQLNQVEESKFSAGDIAFRITEHKSLPCSVENLKNGSYHLTHDFSYVGVEYCIVNTHEEYEKKLYTHNYSPILFSSTLPTRIAYLYDCLNKNFRTPRENSFIAWYRVIGTNVWKPWFVVPRYVENPYSGVEYV